MAVARGGVAPGNRPVRVRGTIRPPGDKSISHRALLVGALARGTGSSAFTGLLTGEDVKSTARVLRQLGARISSIRNGATVVVHASRLTAPSSRLNCGNSGTTARLLLGVLAGQGFAARVTGDASLKRRPMRRVTEPLRAMGADIKEEAGDSLPLTIRGGRLRPLTYTTPVASAQIKSALLLAGLTGQVRVTLREPYLSRDHTERLFVHLGLGLHRRDGAIVYEPATPTIIAPFSLAVPADASSAAFLVAVAVLAESGDLVVEQVGVNPTRTGFLTVLERMGSHVERVNLHDEGGEPVADLLVRPATHLRGTEITAAEVPTLVDEIPILACVASRAEGETVFRDVGELRVKESNRLELIAANLRAVGVAAEAVENDLHVRGGDRPPRGRVETALDHRIAMAFAVLGTVPGAEVRLSERRSVAISYPGFFADLRNIRDGGRGKRQA
jgi:3-phosphoshikimate 1-carboxyvinyltransferase